MTSYKTGRMPHRLLGSSGLRVPLFSLGGCECLVRAFGRRPDGESRADNRRHREGGCGQGDNTDCCLYEVLIKEQNLIKAAWDHGINMIDTAECYDNGQSELEM
jgi:aryl-alcohol dehydrogenase-like predicted oxidoreductase